jgi:hypothetical protein
VLWTYVRGGRQLHYEIRLAIEGAGYELRVRYPDGPETTERFENAESLTRRTHELQEQLIADGWWLSSNPPGSPDTH